MTDLGTHKLFLAQVTDGETLSSVPAMTYAYYHANVKPKPAAPKTGKKGWRCKICGYVYEGETLPRTSSVHSASIRRAISSRSTDAAPPARKRRLRRQDTAPAEPMQRRACAVRRRRPRGRTPA